MDSRERFGFGFGFGFRFGLDSDSSRNLLQPAATCYSLLQSAAICGNLRNTCFLHPFTFPRALPRTRRLFLLFFSPSASARLPHPSARPVLRRSASTPRPLFLPPSVHFPDLYKSAPQPRLPLLLPLPRALPFRAQKKAPARKPSRIDFRFSVLCGRIPRLSVLYYKVETSRQKDLPPLPAPSFLAPPSHRPAPLRRLPRRARASAASAPMRPHAPAPPPPLRLRPIPPVRAGCPSPRPPSGHSRPPPPGAPRRCRWQGPHTQTSGNR